MGMMEFSETLKQLRRAKQFSQEELAAQLGLTAQAVSKWECAQSYPDVEVLISLADLFGVSLDQLLRGKDTDSGSFDSAGIQNDGVLRVVQYCGNQLLKCDEYDPERKIPLVIPDLQDDQKLKIEVWGSTAIDGDVYGDVMSHGSLNCGNVSGNVNAGTWVNCGMIGGCVNAGDNVNCGNVGGYVNAGDNVNCGNVGGYVTAGDNVRCGTVAQTVKAGDGVYCGDIGGDVSVGVELHCNEIQGDCTCKGDLYCKVIHGNAECHGNICYSEEDS